MSSLEQRPYRSRGTAFVVSPLPHDSVVVGQKESRPEIGAARLGGVKRR